MRAGVHGVVGVAGWEGEGMAGDGTGGGNEEEKTRQQLRNEEACRTTHACGVGREAG